MNVDPLINLSPIDGRYRQKTQFLQPIFSEFGLIKYRLTVEINWLIALSEQEEITEVPRLNSENIAFLAQLRDHFSLADAQHIKTIESQTNHDVKALEYFIKEKISTQPQLKQIGEFIHFACTSEDINNVAHALMLKEGRAHLLQHLHTLSITLQQKAEQYAKLPMLARTHGQSASPTTLGKELANFCARLTSQLNQFNAVNLRAKFNGAVGNFNAHITAYPHIDWQQITQTFVESFGLVYTPLSTQIEPHDYIAEYFHTLCRINTILLDLSRDIWGYIAIDYFKQYTVKDEVGSSTMPHKINPIDFENAEGNLGIANALAQHLADKLPISRWQRDLSDSTVLRNLGVVCAHSLIAYQAIHQGLTKLAVNETRINEDLEANWQVLAEPIQTVMRRYRIDRPYEKLKAFSRGKAVDKKTLHAFIDTLTLPEQEKKHLKQLTPHTYIGQAAAFVLSK